MILRASWNWALSVWTVAVLGALLASSAALANDWRRTGDVNLLIQELVDGGASPCPVSGYNITDSATGPDTASCITRNGGILISMEHRPEKYIRTIQWGAPNLNSNSRRDALAFMRAVFGDGSGAYGRVRYALDSDGPTFRQAGSRTGRNFISFEEAGHRVTMSTGSVRRDLGGSTFNISVTFDEPEVACGIFGDPNDWRCRPFLQGAMANDIGQAIMWLLWVPALLAFIVGVPRAFQSLLSFDKFGNSLGVTMKRRLSLLIQGVALMLTPLVYVFIFTHLMGI